MRNRMERQLYIYICNINIRSQRNDCRERDTSSDKNSVAIGEYRYHDGYYIGAEINARHNVLFACKL